VPLRDTYSVYRQFKHVQGQVSFFNEQKVVTCTGGGREYIMKKTRHNNNDEDAQRVCLVDLVCVCVYVLFTHVTQEEQ